MKLALALLFLANLDGLETIDRCQPNGRGSCVQTILTRPRGTAAKLPAVMLVPWLSCDGVDFGAGPLDGMNELSRRIATRSGFVYLRVDKPKPCADADFQTELAGYRAAFESLRAHAWVDPDRIILIGMSNGGGILPLVSNGRPVAGYVVVNGWSSTWFEHMLDHLRRSQETNGAVAKRMQELAELYADYLLEKKLPRDVIAAKPYLAALWEGDQTRQYGRPAAFFHQLQELNLAEAWSRVKEPTLAVWGEADVIMSRADHQRIVDLVNRNTPDAARLIVVPKMDHFVERDGRFPDEVFTSIDEWMKRVAK